MIHRGSVATSPAVLFHPHHSVRLRAPAKECRLEYSGCICAAISPTCPHFLTRPSATRLPGNGCLFDWPARLFSAFSRFCLLFGCIDCAGQANRSTRSLNPFASTSSSAMQAARGLRAALRPLVLAGPSSSSRGLSSTASRASDALFVRECYTACPACSSNLRR